MYKIGRNGRITVQSDRLEVMLQLMRPINNNHEEIWILNPGWRI